jgi:hypothetical protein
MERSSSIIRSVLISLIVLCVVFICWAQFGPLASLKAKAAVKTMFSGSSQFEDTLVCRTGKPCNTYSDDVDFRIIVLTFDRDVSLLKLLNSLQDLELDGDKAVIEIWLDVDTEGKVNEPTARAAQSFRWKKGPTRVHVQTSHAGIRGQWIDTWRPRPESREIGLILEDDINVSPMAYRWLKAVHKGMKNRTDFVGATLTSDQMSILSSTPKGPLVAPKNDTILMYKCFGTWGFSPKPEHWRRFQVCLILCFE